MTKRKSIDKKFFKRWSPEMAYVLGFFAADGNLVATSRGTYFLAFHSSDKEVLEVIQRVMKSGHRLSKRSVRSGNVYRFQIGSKEMFKDLEKLGFRPGKTKRLKLPQVPKKFRMDFVRGYFDGDGNVWVGKINKSRNKSTDVIQVAFTSGSIQFLESLMIALRKVGLVGGYIYRSEKKQFGRLVFSTLDSLKLHEIMYNMPSKLFLKRKKLVFERFIKMRA